VTLREKLFNAIWREGFHPDEDPAIVEEMKVEWADDAAGVKKITRIAIATFRQWLADQGLVVVPRDATPTMSHAGESYMETMDDDAYAQDVWHNMIAAAPDALAKDATT
jgi:hypothetical protein